MLWGNTANWWTRLAIDVNNANQFVGRSISGALGTTSWSSLRWRAVVHHVGNRTGLVLCGDLKTAAAIVVKESAAFTNGNRPSAEDVRKLAASYEPLRELLRFAVSDDHFLLREKVGTAIAKIASA